MARSTHNLSLFFDTIARDLMNFEKVETVSEGKQIVFTTSGFSYVEMQRHAFTFLLERAFPYHKHMK